MTDSGLYAYIEGLRRDLGWSQNELAARAGHDRQIFVRMRNGGKISHETIFALAEVLGVAPAELLRLQGYPVDKLGVVSESLEPRELSRGELVDEARRKLSHDELLALVRERMRDVPPVRPEPDDDPEPDEDAVLRAHEPGPPLRASRPKPTGRRRASPPEASGEASEEEPVKPSDEG